MINKLSINKDSTINYRQLTDKSVKDLELLSNNNIKIQIPSDTELLQNIISLEKLDNTSVATTKSGNLIEYNGNLIDLENIMVKLDKSESLTQTLETKLKDSNDQLSKFQ